MRIVLEQTMWKQKEKGNSTIAMEHMPGAIGHDPNLLEFARYAEDLVHRLKHVAYLFDILFLIDGEREFKAITKNEGVAYMLFNYFRQSKYVVDIGYDEELKNFFVTGNKTESS